MFTHQGVPMPQKIAALIFLVAAGLAYAQSQQTPARDPWKLPRASSKHSDLAWLIGSWRIEKRYSPNPFVKGTNLVETEQCAWAVGGYYVICNSTDILDGNKPVRETVIWSQDAEPHIVKFVDISPDDSTDQPTAGWCRIDGDMWYCDSEPKLENGRSIHLRFITKNTAASASGHSLFSEDGITWLPLSEDSFTRQQGNSQPGSTLGGEPDSFFIDKEKEVWEALKHKDKAADSDLLADEFVGLYNTGFATKSDHAKQMNDRYSIDSYNLQDAKILRLSPQMALLLYKATCKGSGEWEEYCSRPDFVSSLWVERDRHWVNLFSQDTLAAGNEKQPDTTRLDDQLSAQALAKEKEILETLKRNDWPAFADLLADDVVAINEDGIVGKKELIDGIKAAGTIFSDYKMENVKVIPQGNGAIVAYRETLVGTQNGKSFTWHIYTHSHWERRGDKWLMTMFQDSMAKEQK
jgi:hypothetical protein